MSNRTQLNLIDQGLSSLTNFVVAFFALQTLPINQFGYFSVLTTYTLVAVTLPRVLIGDVLLAVGAGIDRLAGMETDAPAMVPRAGLEWAYRLAHNPRRLAGRYAVGNFTLLIRTVQHRKKGRTP